MWTMIAKWLGFYGLNQLLLYLLHYNRIYNIIYKPRKLTTIFKDNHIFYQIKLKFRYDFIVFIKL